jgi:hypothetical protein
MAVFVNEPNATAAQRYGRLIDLFPGLIAWLPLPFLLPSLSNSFRNHREALESAPTQFSPRQDHYVSTTAFFKVAMRSAKKKAPQQL